MTETKIPETGTPLSRRDFLRMAGAAGAGAALGAVGGAKLAQSTETSSAALESPIKRLNAVFAELEKSPLSVDELLTALRTGNGLPDVSVVTYDEPDGEHYNDSTGQTEPYYQGERGLKALCFRLDNDSVVPAREMNLLAYTSHPTDLGWSDPEAFVYTAVSGSSFPENGAFLKGLASGGLIPKLDRQIGVITTGDFQGAVKLSAKEIGIYVGELG